MNNDRKKILIVIIVLVILAGVIVVVRRNQIQMQNADSNTDVETTLNNTEISEAPQEEGRNIIRLTAENSSVKTGEDLNVKVSFSAPEKKIFGSDLVILYDPDYVTTDKESIEAMPFFASFPRIDVDNDNGMIKVSAYQSADEVLGEDNNDIVNIKFKTLKAGSGKIELSFIKGQTNTTTLVENVTSQNVLDRVENLDFQTVE